MSRSMAAAWAVSTLVLAACGGADRAGSADTARVAGASEGARTLAGTGRQADAATTGNIGAVSSALTLKVLVQPAAVRERR